MAEEPGAGRQPGEGDGFVGAGAPGAADPAGVDVAWVKPEAPIELTRGFFGVKELNPDRFA